MAIREERHQYIVLFRGDDSDFVGNQQILLKLETELDLTGCKAHFRFLDFKQDFNEIPVDKTLELVFPKAQTAKFSLGAMDAELWLEDSTGKRRTVANKIHVVVTNSVKQAYDNDDPQAITVVITSGNAESISWNNITGKPSTFPPSAHTHQISQVEGLQEELNQKVNKIQNATAGNLASLTSDGEIQNSGESVASLKEYTNTQVATNTANFLGTYDYATDLGFTPPSTSADVDNDSIAAALPSHVEGTPTNNDYVFVVINYTATTPADEFRRFKYNATDAEWFYEYTLNSASFTPAQWAAINSGITGIVAPSSSATMGQAADAKATGDALAGKASTADATLTSASAWSILHTPLTDEQKAAFYEESQDAAQNDYAVTIRSGVDTYLRLYVGEAHVADLSVSADGLTASYVGGSSEAEIVWGPYDTTVATRVALQGYVLGGQTSKPLASETEAADLRAALTLVAPDWSADRTYQQYDVVKYAGGYYYALTSVGADIPPMDVTKWASLANLAALAHQFLPITGGTMTGNITILQGPGSAKDAIITTTIGSSRYGALECEAGGISTFGEIIGCAQGFSSLYAKPSDIGIPAFSASATYALGAKVVHDNALWNCTTAVSTAREWNAANWTKLFDLSTDSTPTANSDSLMTSGDIKTALDAKADAAKCKYSFNTATVTLSTTTDTNDTAAVTGIVDHEKNTATLASTVTAATITIPARTDGYTGDLFLSLTIDGSAPSITFTDAATSADLDVIFGESQLSDIDTGRNLILFSEVEQNKWKVAVEHEDFPEVTP